MTLLVISIAIPELRDQDSVGQLADALNDRSEDIISFVVSFLVIGRYWMAHHQFFGLLKAMDQGLIGLNLVYLMFIAFLPFPTALLGDFFNNPLSVVVYAATVAVVSGMEVVLYRHAHLNGLMTRKLPEDVFRWGMLTSSAPLAYFAISIPVAFVNTSIAVACWFLAVPLGILLNRRKPETADDYLN
jgi:uncharacterized membrane protein